MTFEIDSAASLIDSHSEAVRRSVADRFSQTVGDLGRLVRIPSVSWDAFERAHVAESAEAVAELLSETGLFDTVEVHAATGPHGEQGQPAVLAHRPARSGAPTVLLYSHHDVQPPGADELWQTPPFEPTVVNGRLYGRGASDDKAGVIGHVAALRTLVDVLGDDPNVGISLFIEGEEEFGSSTFPTLLHTYRDILRADAIIVADSGNWSTTVPAITVALRGAVAFNVTIRTLDHSVHSGMFGGAVPDAMMAATTLISRLWDESGSVAVPGLASIDMAVPEYDEAQLREESGLSEGVSPIGTGDILNRIWAQPAISVTGIDAPSVPVASNTLIDTVRFRLSARVAPGQSSEDAFAAIEKFVTQNVPFGAQLTIADVDLGAAFQLADSGPLTEVLRSSLEAGWEAAPVDMGGGGSIPFIAVLAEEFPQAEVLVTGVEDPDSRAHSPNESQDLEVLRKSITAEALYLVVLSELTGAGAKS